MSTRRPFESIIQKLSRFGEVTASSLEQQFWPDYSTFIMDRESHHCLLHVLAHTGDFYCQPHNWYLPVHAARICALNQDEEALPWLIEALITTDNQDDWAREILFEILPLYKEKLLASAKTYLFEEPIFPQELWGHIFLVDIVRRIGLESPLCRTESIHLLKELLKAYRYHPFLLNNVLIDDLCLLKEEAAIPLIHEICTNQFALSPQECWSEVCEAFNLQSQDLIFERNVAPRTSLERQPDRIADFQLRKILATHGCAASLEELKAMMAGALCSRSPVSLKTVCDTVLVNNENQPIVSENPAQFQCLAESVSALWQELFINLQKIKAGDTGATFEPHIFSSIDESQLDSLKLQYESSAEEAQILVDILAFTIRTEVSFFLKGINLGENKNLSDFTQNIQNQFTGLDKTKDLQSKGNKPSFPSFLELEKEYRRILDLKDYWRQNYILFAKELL